MAEMTRVALEGHVGLVVRNVSADNDEKTASTIIWVRLRASRALNVLHSATATFILETILELS